MPKVFFHLCLGTARRSLLAVDIRVQGRANTGEESPVRGGSCFYGRHKGRADHAGEQGARSWSLSGVLT